MYLAKAVPYDESPITTKLIGGSLARSRKTKAPIRHKPCRGPNSRHDPFRAS